MKVKRYILLILLGAVIGGIIGVSSDWIDLKGWMNADQFATTSFIIWMTLIFSALILLLTLIQAKVQHEAIRYKNQFSSHMDGEQTDQIERKANIKYLTASVIVYGQYILSFISLLLLVIGGADSEGLLIGMIPFLLVSVSAVMIGVFQHRFDARMPKLGEANYVGKSMQIMDEGERHIAIVSMFKVYHFNISLLLLGILVLVWISIVGNYNQAPGIIVLIILFGYNGFGYLWKVSRFYRE
ncbi:DUF3169 family protein [Staphylococcus coagulans]|uniref:DUF3169 family protein n=1 Tax=Staphylococcus coagulans TaxID=74706 RepID=UPI001F4C28B1|nr:DUF3169 family protein [Staphylococcus coagulans]UNB46343.1 DUF3169 family protein [Staphylococcus coagulans]